MFVEHLNCIKKFGAKVFILHSNTLLCFFLSIQQHLTLLSCSQIGDKTYLCPEYRIGFLSIILSAQIFKICLIHANNIPSLPYSNIIFNRHKGFSSCYLQFVCIWRRPPSRSVGRPWSLPDRSECGPPGGSSWPPSCSSDQNTWEKKTRKINFKSEHSTKCFITSMKHSVTHLPILLCQITPIFFQVNLLCVDLQSMLQEPEGQIKFLHSMQDQTNVALQCNRIQWDVAV